jgi:hypothetical protein
LSNYGLAELGAWRRWPQRSGNMQIQEPRWVTGNGFQPFTVYLSDGRSFDVPHPDFIALSSRGVVIMGRDELPNLIDPSRIVSAKPEKSRSVK